MKIACILSGYLYTFINIIAKNNIYDTNYAVNTIIYITNYYKKLRVKFTRTNF